MFYLLISYQLALYLLCYSAPSVKGSGECGTVYEADPLDACSPLKNIVPTIKEGCPSPFALIVRGGCSFEDKVRIAQTAGFKAAIVYDNEDGDLVASNYLILELLLLLLSMLFNIYTAAGP